MNMVRRVSIFLMTGHVLFTAGTCNRVAHNESPSADKAEQARSEQTVAPSAKSPIVARFLDKNRRPSKITVLYLGEEKHERLLTDDATISRVWDFITSHLTRRSKLYAPAPYELSFRCEFGDGEQLATYYQAGEWGFHAEDSHGNEIHGNLTDEQRRVKLTQITKDLLGFEY